MSEVKLIDGYAMARRIASDGVKNGDTTIMTLAGFACSYVNDEPEAVVRCMDCKHGRRSEYLQKDGGHILCKLHPIGGNCFETHPCHWYCADGEKA